MSAKDDALVTSEFERALGEILARVSASPANPVQNPAIAIAYSGGLDSSALLRLAKSYADAHGTALCAFHIHHGISPNADAWAAFCEAQCAALGVPFAVRRIRLDGQQKSGTEEAARIARYAALGALCRQYQAPVLLTAHHQDDQAETVLLQLLRGSGVAGLSGMDVANVAPDLLGDSNLLMGRPLLALAREDLAQLVAEKGIATIEDESNTDPRFARNALRHEVMPAIARLFPGFAQRFARSAQHAQSAQRLLIDLAAQDLQSCLVGQCIDLAQLRLLSSDRIDNLLRYWFGSRRVRMPSTAWLAEMRSQLLEAKPDAQLCVTHADCHIRRHRDRVYLTPKDDIDPQAVLPRAFRWQGETVIDFPEFGGSLHFLPAAEGMASAWLKAQDLVLRYRSGGERLKLAPNRHTRSLKHHCQALDIPAWERERLLILAAGKEILYVSGIGMDCQHLGSEGGSRLRLAWQPEPLQDIKNAG